MRRWGHYEPIAREGYPFFMPLLVLSVLFWGWGYVSLSGGSLALAVSMALFFRNPERISPAGAGLLVCPADGRVMEILENAESRHIHKVPLRRISIFMSPLNVHVNRWPVSGAVTRIAYSSGGFLDARNPQASVTNEHNALVIDSPDGPIAVVQIAGFLARRIVCWAREGDYAIQGERFGLIRFGSRVDVYFPHHFSPCVSVGTKVKAGVTILARKTS